MKEWFLGKHCATGSMEFDISEKQWKDIQESLAAIDDYEKGDNNMNNEILELWLDRTMDNIMKKQNETKADLYENKWYVNDFNDIQTAYEREMTNLKNKILETEHVDLIKRVGNKFILDSDAIEDTFLSEVEYKFDNQRMEIDNKYQEITAMLSLSDEKDYQIDILKKYGVLDKKTGKLKV